MPEVLRVFLLNQGKGSQGVLGVVGVTGSSSTVSILKVLNCPVPAAKSWWDWKMCSFGASASSETVAER